ncbi:RING finger protein 227 [Lissotriton helveticus]
MPELERDSDCPICFMRYDRSGRAPRCLPCGHALCTRCLCEMLATCRQQRQKGGRVTCPFCRAPTQLDCGCRHSDVTSMPLDLGLWEKLGPDSLPGEEQEESPCTVLDDTEVPSAGKWKPWRALKKLVRGRDNRTPARTTRRQGFGHDDMRDLALMTCYLI